MRLSHHFYSFKTILSEHWLAVFVALLVGIFCILPAAMFTTDPSYAGVALVGPADEEHYVARIQQIYSGHESLSNTFLPNKDQAYFQPALGEIAVFGVGKPLGLSATEAALASKFIFPFLAALMMYGLVYTLFRSIPVALISTLCVFFADNLMSGITPWLRLLHGVASEAFLQFTRPVNPQVSALLLFVALYVLYRGFFERSRARLWEIIALGLLIGAQAYLNPYDFLFLVVLCSALFTERLWRKDYKTLLSIVYVGGITFIAIIPFIFNYVRLIADPNYVESAVRFGVILTHAPIIGIWVSLLILCPLLVWPKEYAKSKMFFLLSGISILILINQQVITGHLMQQNHFHFYITKPLAEIMAGMYAVFIVGYIFHRISLRIVAYALIATVFVLNGALMQYYSYFSSYPTAVAAQRYGPTLTFLETLPQEEVIWADRNLSTYIPMYTGHSVPNNYYAASYLVSNAYLEERVLFEYRMRNVPPSEIYEQLQKNRADVSLRIFQLYWRENAGSYDGIPDTLLQKYAADYASLYKKSYEDVLQEMGVTMLAWDKKAEPMWDIKTIPSAEKIFERGDFVVYRVE